MSPEGRFFDGRSSQTVSVELGRWSLEELRAIGHQDVTYVVVSYLGNIRTLCGWGVDFCGQELRGISHQIGCLPGREKRLFGGLRGLKNFPKSQCFISSCTCNSGTVGAERQMQHTACVTAKVSNFLHLWVFPDAELIVDKPMRW